MENEIKQHIKTLNAYEYTLLNTICDYAYIKFDDLVGQRSNRKFVNARKIASYLLHKKGYTYNEIGSLISLIHKDHTTIMYYIEKANEHMQCELNFKNIIDSVTNVTAKYEDEFSTLKYKKCKK
jgi:chromosomal replication initiation ATPase DnaA